MDRYVSTRVARHTYGTRVAVNASTVSPLEQLLRPTFVSLDGELSMAGAYAPILRMVSLQSSQGGYRYLMAFAYRALRCPKCASSAHTCKSSAILGGNFVNRR